MVTTRGILVGLVAATLALAATACTSTGPATEQGAAQTTGKTCFNAMEITSFDPLQGPFLYVRVGTNEHYLLTLDRESEPLRRVWNIQISPNFPRVCSGMRAPLTYQYQGSVGVYNIVGVEKVQSKQQAQTLAAERTSQLPAQP